MNRALPIWGCAHEPDGDFHIRLALDPGQEDLLNEKNMTVQHGDLVIEPICEHPVTQADAIGSCENFAGGSHDHEKECTFALPDLTSMMRKAVTGGMRSILRS
jgi:hypothetical protein